MQAIALVATAKKGISALQLQRNLGVAYRTAWYLSHRLREAMADQGGLLSGIVEADETYVGGKAKNMHAKQREEKIGGRGVRGKDTVFGMVERDGRVKTYHVPALNRFHVIDKLKEGISVETSSRLHRRKQPVQADAGEHPEARNSKPQREGICSRRNSTLGTIDGYWGLLKRSLIGSYHRVSIKHLHRYLSECEFKWNNRENQEIFAAMICGLVIKGALRYKALTGPRDSGRAGFG